MKRLFVALFLALLLALVVAIPTASGKRNANLANLTAEWWNWAASINPSPIEGSYNGGPRCEGEYVEGVFFLAAAGGTDPVRRTCTVPADTPIFFPVVNLVCSEAFGAAGQDPPDPEPYDTACVEPVTDETVDPPSKFFATLDGEKLALRRIASGLFQWTIVFEDNPFPNFIPGTYESASDGLWVYLKEGLPPGKHRIVFGGRYRDTPLGSFKGARVTYRLTAQ
jgi:hypothetical protein